jgi:hypothetical protein
MKGNIFENRAGQGKSPDWAAAANHIVLLISPREEGMSWGRAVFDMRAEKGAKQQRWSNLGNPPFMAISCGLLR